MGIVFAIVSVCFALITDRVAMTESERQRQTAELRSLQYSNPRQLIDEYCRMTGEYCGNQMPRGASFSRMIDTIVELRAATETADATTR